MPLYVPTEEKDAAGKPKMSSQLWDANAIEKVDDFKGKKLRVNATAAERAKMRQLGASAVPMDLAEVIPGLQQGVIDGTSDATRDFAP